MFWTITDEMTSEPKIVFKWIQITYYVASLSNAYLSLKNNLVNWEIHKTKATKYKIQDIKNYRAGKRLKGWEICYIILEEHC